MKDKLLIISHAYLRDDIYQSLLYLKKEFDLLCLVPKKNKFFKFKKNKHLLNKAYDLYLEKFFLFKKKPLIIKKFNPKTIIIEYNPWSIIFIQLIIYIKIFNINPKIILHIKDNKFVKYKYFKYIIFYLLKRNINSIWFASSVGKKNFTDLFLKKKDKIKSLTVPIHPIDTKFYKKNKKINKKKIIHYGFIGRPDFDKGFNHLIDAFKNIKTDNCTLDLMLPYRKFWKNKNIILNFRKYKKINITINKFNKFDVLNFYKKIDVLISPSIEGPYHMEQDGQVLLESLSCQNIAISSNVGFFKDIKTTNAFFKINIVNIKKFYNSILKINKNYNKIKKFTFKNRILVQKNFAIKPVNNRKISLLKN
jgi:glycosyltransferase involved in cell wall biosynthesis